MPNVIYIPRRIIKVEEIIVEGNDSGEVGSQIQLTAIVLPTNATNKVVIWSSSDTSKATVDQNGNVELLAEGNVTITATATDGSGISGSKVLTITPAIVLPTVLTINPTSVSYTSATVGGNVTSAGNGTVSEKGTEYSTNSNFTNKTIKVIGSGTGTFSTGLTSLNSNTTYYVRAYATNEAGTAYGEITSFSTLIYVTSISVSNDFTAYVGDTYLVSVLSILPSNATNKNVSWSSSNTSKATVNSSGLVTLLSTGSVIITATAADGSGVVDTINVTILEATDPTIYVESISISGASSGTVGSTIQLAATVLPSNADNTSVTWSSSGTNKATVDQNGLVHLWQAGEVMIYAIANDGSGVYGYKEISINSANIPVTSISVTGNNSGVVGSTIQLSAAITPSNATNQGVTWLSSDTAKATVNSSGLVTLIAAGSVTITATAADGSGVSGSKGLTITAAVVPVTAISIVGNSSGYVNTTIQLSATVTPSNATNKNITWSSSNTSVATVNSSGLVTLVAAGSVTITATAADGSGVTSTKSIQVLAIARPIVSTDSVSTITARTAIVNCSISSAEGGTIAHRGVLYTTASDFSGASLGVEATTNSIGTYSLQISNLNPNTTYYVRAYATNEAGSTNANILSFTTLTEQVPVTSISISGNSTGEVGTTIQLAATVTPSNATNRSVIWSSSDTAKATVNSSGLVTLIAAGNVTITASATDGSGVSGSKALTITSAVVPVTDPSSFTYEKQSSLSEIVSSVAISTNGNYLYLLYPVLQVIRRYTLTTPFDIGTKTTYQEYSYAFIGETASFEGGLFISPDEKNITFCLGNKIKTIVLNVANDFSSELYVSSHLISEGTFAVSGISFDSTGTICSVSGQMTDSTKRIYVYSSSSPFRLSGTVTLLHFAVISSASKPTGFEFNADGTAYYIADFYNTQLNKYLISGNNYTPNNVNTYGTSTINASYTIATGSKTIVDFCFSNDLQKMYVIGRDESDNYFVLQYFLS